jgi:hypothetical protein
LFTAPEDVPIYGIDVARKTRILLVMQNLLDRRNSIESSILAILHENEIKHTLLANVLGFTTMINVLRRCLRKLRGTEEILGEGLVSLGLGGLGCDIALLLLFILWSTF